MHDHTIVIIPELNGGGKKEINYYYQETHLLFPAITDAGGACTKI